ncbi:hypothetical protein GCM10027203_07760 [Nonomuraea fastidiosa]
MPPELQVPDPLPPPDGLDQPLHIPHHFRHTPNHPKSPQVTANRFPLVRYRERARTLPRPPEGHPGRGRVRRRTGGRRNPPLRVFVLDSEALSLSIRGDR